MMTRRSFLGSILALGAAPAIVKAEILMPVRQIIVPDFDAAMREAMLDAIRYGTGVHTTAHAGQIWGRSVIDTPEHRAAQKALNARYRAMMDNAHIPGDREIALGHWPDRHGHPMKQRGFVGVNWATTP